MEIVAALELANRVAGADVIILARGGGSLEDLWTFNEESVVRAIVASHLPVVSAVGHEIDVTLADLAADRRALTPSEAGEVCVPDAREVALHLDRLADRLRLAGLGQLRDARDHLDQLGKTSLQAIQQDLLRRRQRVLQLAATLEALSPAAVLARGYSLTFLADGMTLVRSSDDVKAGDLLRTHLAAGQVNSRVV